MFIYVLLLRDKKYYVGKSSNVEQRFLQHLQGNGSIWTSIHEPVRVIQVQRATPQVSEDQVVKSYMRKHGVDNVRGGSYSQVSFDYHTRRFLQREVASSTDACFRCGRRSHFVVNCYARTHVDGTILAPRGRYIEY